jgi:uncharacterized repeat protein (TIGR01451 family)
MRVLKRVGASALAFGVAAAGMVFSAPIASAHTGTLKTSYVCQTDGTYKITYSGSTSNVPTSGPGHVATLTIGEVQPVGTTISGAPATVTGNTSYGFSQVVPGTATSAQATAFLAWGDGAKSDPIGKVSLKGDCKPPVVKKPSGHLDTDCVNGGGHVVASNLDKGTFPNTTWRLVSGTPASHTNVVATQAANGSLEASGLPDATQVWLQYNNGNGTWVDEGSTKTTGNCTPPVVVQPSGDLATDCVNGGGHVVASNLDKGTFPNTTWRLVSGTPASHTNVVGTQAANGSLEASGLPDATQVWLQYNNGNGTWVDEGSTKTTGNCTPPVVVPTGSFTVVCSETGATVTIGTLSSGSKQNVVWTLTYGSASKTVSTGEVVAVPALSALALKYVAGDNSSGTVQTRTAPDACPPTGTVDKTAQPASGSVVSPGQAVTYTVTVKNTGSVKIDNKPAVDTLPAHVTLVAGSITGGGTASSDGRSITWAVTLDPGASATYTYQVTVDADAPAKAALLNRVVFLQDEATTTHEVGERSLEVVKSVTPTGDAEFGDTLTYNLKVTAGGNLGQTAVVVTDYLPGYKPGRDSGTTTYVAGSAGCDAGTCTAAYDDATKLITWQLGDMAPGSSRTVTFQVTIDTPAADADGGLPATTIFNSAAVASTETPKKPSNEVETPVTAVLGVKHGQTPAPPTTSVSGGSLPHTGAGGSLPWMLSAAGMFTLLGGALIMVARKPKVVRVR